MSKVYVKKVGNSGVVYLNEFNQSIPFASFEDEPIGFPFTDKMDELRKRFGTDMVIIEDPRQPPVSGVQVSDAQIIAIDPAAKRELGEHKPIRAAQTQQTLAPAAPPSVDGIERLACDRFRSMIKNWHYSKGREKKEIGRDIEAVASFLIDLSPALEPVLQRIKDEETMEKKRFTL